MKVEMLLAQFKFDISCLVSTDPKGITILKYTHRYMPVKVEVLILASFLGNCSTQVPSHKLG